MGQKLTSFTLTILISAAELVLGFQLSNSGLINLLSENCKGRSDQHYNVSIGHPIHITTPNNTSNCRVSYNISTDSSHVLHISFDEFNLTGNDSLTVYDGDNKDNSHRLNKCTSTMCPSLTTNNPAMIVYFSGVQNRNSTFQATVSSVDPCSGNASYNLTASNVTEVTTPNYPMNYTHDCVRFYYFYTDKDHYIRLTFDNIDIADGDLLKVYNGIRKPGKNETNKVQRCGDRNKTCSPVTVTGSQITLLFTSDNSSTTVGHGFQVSVETVIPCNGTEEHYLTPGSPINITLPNFPIPYSAFCQRYYYLYIPHGDTMQMTFDYFTTDLLDYLYIYSGIGVNVSNQVKKCSGRDLCASVTRPNSNFTLFFQSSDHNVGEGFWATVESIKQITTTSGPKKPASSQETTPLGLILGLTAAAVFVLGALVAVAVYWRIHQTNNYNLRTKKTGLVTRNYSSGTDFGADGSSCFRSRSLGSRRCLLAHTGDEWELEREDVFLHEELGSGYFGRVWKGTLRVSDATTKRRHQFTMASESRDKVVAVKTLPLNADPSKEVEFRKEIELMKELGSHVHLVKMVGCVSLSSPLLLLLHFCNNGSLLSFLRQRRPLHPLPEDEENIPENDRFQSPLPAAEGDSMEKDTIDDSMELGEGRGSGSVSSYHLLSFAWQISDGMEYLSSKGYVHRDLAARNVLIMDTILVKIGDFGLSRRLEEAEECSEYVSRGGRMPLKWMPLEAIRENKFSVKSDVWSYGVVLFEIFSFGLAPFSHIQPCELEEYLENGGRLSKPTSCETSIWDIAKHCWGSKPNERPGFGEIKEKLTHIIELINGQENQAYVEACS